MMISLLWDLSVDFWKLNRPTIFFFWIGHYSHFIIYFIFVIFASKNVNSLRIRTVFLYLIFFFFEIGGCNFAYKILLIFFEQISSGLKSYINSCMISKRFEIIFNIFFLNLQLYQIERVHSFDMITIIIYTPFKYIFILKEKTNVIFSS